MAPQIWVKSEEKWAYILVLRDYEVSCVQITGGVLTLEVKVQEALEAVEQGVPTSELMAKSVESLDIRTITKGEVTEGNSELTLYGGQDGATTLVYVAAYDNADEILQTILARSGRTFQQTEEEIDAVEAVIPPAVLGLIGGGLWALLYSAARTVAAGEHAKVQGLRRQAFQRMLIGAAEIMGTGGTKIVGIVLAVLVVAWAISRLVYRPVRTVWLPTPA